MALTLSNVATIVSQYELELSDCSQSRSPNSNPFLEKLTLQKIQQDLPRLLRAANEYKSNKAYTLISKKLQQLSDSVDEGFYEQEQASKVFLDRYSKPTEVSVPESTVSTPENETEQFSGENYASLRKRLLADGAATSLDNDANASSEKMNNYHETFQEDLLSDLTELASSLKNSARTLSAKIVDDANLVSETGENLMKSLTLMQSVGTNLNAYLTEKTGGKITIFFMIKTIAFAFVLFFLMVVLTKILPKM